MNRPHDRKVADQRQANFRGELTRDGMLKQYHADREADYVHHAPRAQDGGISARAAFSRLRRGSGGM
jgi:hypothetical protein